MTLSVLIIALIIGIAIGAVLVMLWSMSIAKRQRNMKQNIKGKTSETRRKKVMEPISDLPDAKYNPRIEDIGLLEFKEVVDEEEKKIRETFIKSLDGEAFAKTLELVNSKEDKNDDQDRSNN